MNRLDPQKGFEIMLRAFGGLASENQDVHLLVAGDGRDRVLLRSLPSELRNRILRLGTVPHAELPRYHAAADVAVSPATGQESFGSCSSRRWRPACRWSRRTSRGTGRWSATASTGSWSRRTTPTPSPPRSAGSCPNLELAATLAAAGRTRAETFSWQSVAPRLEAVYDRVIHATR